MRLPAPAKVNLGLRLLRKRGDGYHEIETFFHTLAWGDELILESADTISLTVENAADATFPEFLGEVPGDSSNLVWRAAALLEERFHMPGVSITLTKRVPPGAGLGGGSSDAAAALKGMNHLFDLGISDDEMREIAAELGADVPFLLSGGCALAGGIGERLTSIAALQDVPLLVLLHPFTVSTGWAYTAARLLEEKSARYPEYLADKGGIAEVLSCIDLRNDLEEPVVKAYPDIIGSLSALRDSGAFYVSMSGSGSAVFGLFTTGDEATAAARGLAGEGFSVLKTVLR